MLYVVLIIFALAGGAITVLAFENFSTLSMDVHLALFVWHPPALPLGVLLLLSFVQGALLLYVVTFISAVRERRELRRLRKRVAELEAAQPAQFAAFPQPPIAQQQPAAPQVFVPMPGTQSLATDAQTTISFSAPGILARTRQSGTRAMTNALCHHHANQNCEPVHKIVSLIHPTTSRPACASHRAFSWR